MDMDVDQNFQVVDRRFVLPFENNAVSENSTRYFTYIRNKKLHFYNYRTKLFDQQVKII